MNLKSFKNLSFAIFFLYFFLVSIKLLEKGIKTLGAEYTDALLSQYPILLLVYWLEFCVQF